MFKSVLKDPKYFNHLKMKTTLKKPRKLGFALQELNRQDIFNTNCC